MNRKFPRAGEDVSVIQHKSQVAFPSDFMVCTTDSVSYLQCFVQCFMGLSEKALTLMVFLGWDPIRKSPLQGSLVPGAWP